MENKNKENETNATNKRGMEFNPALYQMMMAQQMQMAQQLQKNMASMKEQTNEIKQPEVQPAPEVAQQPPVEEKPVVEETKTEIAPDNQIYIPDQEEQKLIDEKRNEGVKENKKDPKKIILLTIILLGVIAALFLVVKKVLLANEPENVTPPKVKVEKVVEKYIEDKNYEYLIGDKIKYQKDDTGIILQKENAWTIKLDVVNHDFAKIVNEKENLKEKLTETYKGLGEELKNMTSDDKGNRSFLIYDLSVDNKTKYLAFSKASNESSFVILVSSKLSDYKELEDIAKVLNSAKQIETIQFDGKIDFGFKVNEVLDKAS